MSKIAEFKPIINYVEPLESLSVRSLRMVEGVTVKSGSFVIKGSKLTEWVIVFWNDPQKALEFSCLDSIGEKFVLPAEGVHILLELLLTQISLLNKSQFLGTSVRVTSSVITWDKRLMMSCLRFTNVFEWLLVLPVFNWKIINVTKVLTVAKYLCNCLAILECQLFAVDALQLYSFFSPLQN